jgi:hypothetical protein
MEETIAALQNMKDVRKQKHGYEKLMKRFGEQTVV